MEVVDSCGSRTNGVQLGFAGSVVISRSSHICRSHVNRHICNLYTHITLLTVLLVFFVLSVTKFARQPSLLFYRVNPYALFARCKRPSLDSSFLFVGKSERLSSSNMIRLLIPMERPWRCRKKDGKRSERNPSVRPATSGRFESVQFCSPRQTKAWHSYKSCHFFFSNLGLLLIIFL